MDILLPVLSTEGFETCSYIYFIWIFRYKCYLPQMNFLVTSGIYWGILKLAALSTSYGFLDTSVIYLKC